LTTMAFRDLLSAISPYGGGIGHSIVPGRESGSVSSHGHKSRIKSSDPALVEHAAGVIKSGLGNCVILLMKFEHNCVTGQSRYVRRVKDQ